MNTYKEIKKEFKWGGFSYSQVKRVENWAIYQQSCLWKKQPNYELVRIRHRGETIMAIPDKHGNVVRKVLEPMEYYPPASTWGTDGFTLTNLEAAETKLKRLVKKK